MKGNIVINFSTEQGQEAHQLGVDFDFYETNSIIGLPYTEPDASGNGGSGGTNGDGSGNCDLSNYNGPNVNIQAGAQCQYAYVYACAGYQPGVDVACELYRQWQQDNPSLPDCTYCE